MWTESWRSAQQSARLEAEACGSAQGFVVDEAGRTEANGQGQQRGTLDAIELGQVRAIGARNVVQVCQRFGGELGAHPGPQDLRAPLARLPGRAAPEQGSMEDRRGSSLLGRQVDVARRD